MNSAHVVSILARPVGRALRQVMACCAKAIIVSILARPVGRALRVCGAFLKPMALFQSSPAPWGERYIRRHRRTDPYGGFNPRPPRGASATQRV